LRSRVELGMADVAIAICTYCRPSGFRRLLCALRELRLTTCADEQVSIVIVDNSPEASAEAICKAESTGSRFRILYVHEPRKGLSNARNAAIAEARRNNVARLAFIDDDEIPEPDWLEGLLSTMNRTGCMLVAGPSFPIFERLPGRWLPVEAYAYCLKYERGLVTDASSGNLLIDLTKLSRFGISFDAEFNETGGEDTYFVSSLIRHGEKVGWAEEAIVWDTIPADRMRPSWLLRRWFRTGLTESFICHRELGALIGRSMGLARGLSRLGYGTVRLGVSLGYLPLGQWHRVTASCFTICRGAGYVAGALGYRFREYSSDRYAL
jgi:glycosyltransferase involved in cell wall biosynthesis